MKTFDKKDVFTLVTAEEAIAYIGKRGYFGDSLEELESNINKGCGDNLGEVFPDRYTSIVFRPYACETSYGLFIPAEKVKVEEKKWRPFNCIEEVFVTLNKDIGSLITYRTKDFPLRTITTTIIGYAKEKNKEDQIQIGTGMIELSNCFEGIEIWNKNEWQPFGVYE